jgi:hypothetical protein
MKTYRVEVPERWIQGYTVKAETPEIAKDKVMAGEGTPVDNDFELVGTIMEDMQHWKVEETDDE